MKTGKILVTGAGGFLGGYIARDLLLKGYQVYSLSRNDYQHLKKMGVHQIRGNIQNYDDVQKATKGMDGVIHTASLVGMWGNYKDFFQTNVLGTQNVLKACQENKVKKLVYTSTPSVVYGEKEIINADESIPYPDNFISHYAKTKSLAEKKVLEANSEDLMTVALRPHLIFGPGDMNLVPRVIASQKSGRLKIIGDGKNQVDVTYVENASELHVLALEKLALDSAICGKAYFIGQGPVELWSFTNVILAKAGLPPVEKKVSLKVAYTLGYFFETLYKWVPYIKSEPPITRFIALQLGTSHFFNHKNLNHDFNYFPKYSIEEGIEKLFSESPLNKLN